VVGITNQQNQVLLSSGQKKTWAAGANSKGTPGSSQLKVASSFPNAYDGTNQLQMRKYVGRGSNIP
jgi:hypothetical protein